MALSKTKLQLAIQSAFDNVFDGKPTSLAASELADAIDDYLISAIAEVTIPSGKVITAVTGGSGSPAVGIPNVAPISLTGDPDDLTGQNGGGLS